MIWFSRNLRSSLEGELDYCKLLLTVGLWLNLLALLFKFFGHFIYIYVTGKEHGLFDFVYLLMHSLSESLITALLIFIAFGWTITFTTGKDFDLYIPLRNILR